MGVSFRALIRKRRCRPTRAECGARLPRSLRVGMHGCRSSSEPRICCHRTPKAGTDRSQGRYSRSTLSRREGHDPPRRSGIPRSTRSRRARFRHRLAAPESFLPRGQRMQTSPCMRFTRFRPAHGRPRGDAAVSPHDPHRRRPLLPKCFAPSLRILPRASHNHQRERALYLGRCNPPRLARRTATPHRRTRQKYRPSLAAG